MLQNPKYNMSYISNFLAMRNSAGGNSPHQAAMIGQQHSNVMGSDCDLDETQLERLSASTGKSFTIASILGLKKKNAAANAEAANPKQKDLNAMNLTIHNSQSYQMHNKTFGGIDADNRLLQNRIPLAFAHHHLQGSHGHPQAPPFYQPTNAPNNNNNNNLNTANHNGTSALQSLQQQFHSKNTSSFPPFHAKEQRNKSEHGIKGKSSLKSKRVRTIFTPEQLERLEGEFERQQYMVGPERLYLAHTLQLTEAQVKVWFQNRRIKWRKHHLEMTQQRLAIIRQCQVQSTNANGDARVNDKSTSGNVLAASPSLTEFDNGNAGNDTSAARDSSELSICTDSMDSSSNHDVDEL